MSTQLVTRWCAVFFAVRVVAFGATLAAQQGQGANAQAGPAANVLRAGPMGSDFGGRLDIVPTVPESFPKELLPPGSTAAAVAIAGSSTIVVSTIAAAPRFDWIRFQWALEDAGWIALTQIRYGFMPAAQMTSATVCRGSTFATLSLSTGVGGERFLRVLAGPNPQRSCAPTGGMRLFSDVPIPPLEVPPGAQTIAGGSGSGNQDSLESAARLDTRLSVTDLAAHFVPQLTAAGWTVEGTAGGDSKTSITRLKSKSKAGDPVTMLLILTVLDDTPYVDAVMRVVRNKPVGR